MGYMSVDFTSVSRPTVLIGTAVMVKVTWELI